MCLRRLAGRAEKVDVMTAGNTDRHIVGGLGRGDGRGKGLAVGHVDMRDRDQGPVASEGMRGSRDICRGAGMVDCTCVCR